MMKLLLITATIFVMLSGCSKENELKKSVMIYDEELTDLPAYSEWGYNTFGAYYDREVFISDNIMVPAKVIVTEGVMSFRLNGRLGTGYYYDVTNEMTLLFNMTDFLPDDYTDLVMLNDTVFDLTDSAYQIKIESAGILQDAVSILSGEFYFKRAQNLLVDKKQIEVILSGYFEFRALINQKPVTISNGRFDVGIGHDNFYIY